MGRSGDGAGFGATASGDRALKSSACAPAVKTSAHARTPQDAATACLTTRIFTDGTPSPDLPALYARKHQLSGHL